MSGMEKPISFVLDPAGMEWEPYSKYMTGAPPNDQITGAPAWDGKFGCWVKVLSPMGADNGMTVLSWLNPPEGFAFLLKAVTKSYELTYRLAGGHINPQGKRTLGPGSYWYREAGLPHGGLFRQASIAWVHYSGEPDEIVSLECERITNASEPTTPEDKPAAPVVSVQARAREGQRRANFFIDSNALEWEPWDRYMGVVPPGGRSRDTFTGDCQSGSFVKILNSIEDGHGATVLLKHIPPPNATLSVQSRTRSEQQVWCLSGEYLGKDKRGQLAPGQFSFKQAGVAQESLIREETISLVHVDGEPCEVLSYEVAS